MNKNIGRFLYVILFATSALAQSRLDSSSATEASYILKGKSFPSNAFYRLLFGTNWRGLWSAPVFIPKLDLNLFAGGIVFVRNESHLIHNSNIVSYIFKNKTGLEYRFTSLDQDSICSLPPELSEILPGDVVNDERSALNPYAQFIASFLLHEVGLPYRPSHLFVLSSDEHPDSSFLSESSKLGILEDPLELPEDTLSSPFIDTRQLLVHLNNNNHERVDEIEYLKVRLLDILIGNWDRSPENIQWYSISSNDLIVWKPIPLYYEKAFVPYDGLLPTIADLAVPQMENCSDNSPNVENLTWNTRALDRRLLVTHLKQTWDSVATWMQLQLKDSVLKYIIDRLPREVVNQKGDELLQLLQSRRSSLPKAAEEYYRILSAYVDIYGSDMAEYIEARRTGRNLISIAMYDQADSSTTRTQLYQRLFHSDNTKEIRILLQGGDDKATIEGEQNSTINLIIDGGEGRNELKDKTKGRSLFTYFNPLATGKTIFYDSNPDSRIVTGSNTRVVRDNASTSLDTYEHWKTTHRDWGEEWTFTPWLDFNPDDGLLIGGGPVYTQYGFRLEPYSYRFVTRAGLATRTGNYCLEASAEFRDWISDIQVLFHLHASQLDFSNFFGLGNETSYNETLDEQEYYRVYQPQIHIGTGINLEPTDKLLFSLDGSLKIVDNNPKPGTLLDLKPLPYYRSTVNYAAFNCRLQYDTRNSYSNPANGTLFQIETTLMPKFIDLKNTFTKFKASARTYFTIERRLPMILALRLNGEKIWENHPFFESAFLGGNMSLRGFERQRFAGDAAILGGLECRTQFMQIPFLVPLWTGISLFGETGRVFLESEKSSRWHNVIGGGVWFSFIKHEYVTSFTLARSEDKFAFYATMGFMF